MDLISSVKTRKEKKKKKLQKRRKEQRDKHKRGELKRNYTLHDPPMASLIKLKLDFCEEAANKN